MEEKKANEFIKEIPLRKYVVKEIQNLQVLIYKLFDNFYRLQTNTNGYRKTYNVNEFELESILMNIVKLEEMKHI